MAEITEGGLKITFPDHWSAIKYDESGWHKNRMGSRLKGMDILASKDDEHWWIEIKDCRGYEDDNRPRLSPYPPQEVNETRKWIEHRGWDRIVKAERKKPFIVDEVVEKFRHTLVALACAQRDAAPELANYRVVDPGKALSVVLLLTWESREFRRLAGRLQQKLRSALSCYAVDAYVIDETIPTTIGLDIKVERITP